MRAVNAGRDREPRARNPGEYDLGGPDADWQDPDQRFRDAVALASRVDPMPTLRALADHTGLDVEQVVHYALYRYAAAGAEALLAVEPAVLQRLIEARRAEDWETVGSLIDFLEAGLDSKRWRR